MKTELRDGEELVKEGATKFQSGFHTAVGRLCLTNQRLVFEPHESKQRCIEVELTNVRSSGPCWSWLVGLIPLYPDALRVRTPAKKYRFVLLNRTEWATAIAEQKNA